MKIKSLYVFIGFLIVFMPGLALADATVALGDVSGDAGENVLVSLTLSSTPQNVSSMNFTIYFDSAVLEYISAAGTAMLTDAFPGGAEKQFEVNSPQNGEVKALIHGMNQNIIGDGVIGNITFMIRNNAPAGDIALDLTDLVACAGDADPVVSTAVDAAVTCSSGGSGGGGASDFDGGSSGCFIATAAFGSKMDRHVSILSEFRDQCLLNNSAGRSFVDLYYRFSPPLAEFLRAHPILRASVRHALIPVTGMAYMALRVEDFVLWMPLALMLIFAAYFARRYSLGRNRKTMQAGDMV